MDRSFSHEAVKDYYEHFVRVCGSFMISAAYEVLWEKFPYENVGDACPLTNGCKSH